MQKITIEKEILNRLFGTFLKHALSIESVILFGSRARGDHKRTSDLDLAVVFRNGLECLTILQDELSQLDIIYGIDLLDYSKIENVKLKSVIDSEGIKIF